MMLHGLKCTLAYLRSPTVLPHLFERNWRVPHINHVRSAVCIVSCHIDRMLTTIGSSVHHKATNISANCPRDICFHCSSLNSLDGCDGQARLWSVLHFEIIVAHSVLT
jgi:hypothetical protein